MKTVQMTTTVRVPDEVAERISQQESMEISFPVFLPEAWTYRVKGLMRVKILNDELR